MSRETTSPAAAALRDLRRTRTHRRIGDTEWYEFAYRVYLFALVGLIAVVVASDVIGGLIGGDVTTAEIVTRGPSAVGIVVTVAIALGLRSGAEGGPISIELADVHHVLLAPIGRRRVFTLPVLQRLRTAMLAGGLSAAVLGQLVAREVAGSRAAWAASGALFGAAVGALWIASAVVVHAVRLPRWAATALGGLLVAWQVLAAWGIWTGRATGLARSAPANLVGSLALWGIRQRWLDVAAIAVTAAIVAMAFAAAGRLRPEPLTRRGQLVSQLRFAATMQDLRTVVLLRRQLRAETLRRRPWLTTPSRRRARRAHAATVAAVWRRGVRSLLRLPAPRLARIVVLAAAGGASASFTVSATPLAAIGLVATTFLLGMESLEPLSQEVDRPDRTDGLPIDRGWLFAHHLLAPAVVLAVAGLAGALTATMLEPRHAAGAFALAVPVAWAGALGAVATTVLDAPPTGAGAHTTLLGAPRDEESPFALAEFAGFSNAFRAAAPVVLSSVAALPVLALRADATAGSVIRSITGLGLVIASVVWWVRRRDRWGARIRAFFVEGRTHA